MAKAKIVKRKRKLKIEGVATLLFTLAVFTYFGAKFGLQSYNILLQRQAQSIEEKAGTLKEAVANLENEVSTLQNRERVLGMVENEGIGNNQENIVVVDKNSQK